MFLSQSATALLYAYEKGYRIKKGEIVNPKGHSLKGSLDSSGYLCLGFKHEGKVYHVPVHRLVAFQKYRYEIFNDWIVVRHLDGNPLNNLENNIAIGTHSDNMFDQPPEVRHRKAIEANKGKSPFDDETLIKIVKDREAGLSYNKLIEKYGTRKSWFSYFFNSNTNYDRIKRLCSSADSEQSSSKG